MSAPEGPDLVRNPAIVPFWVPEKLDSSPVDDTLRIYVEMQIFYGMTVPIDDGTLDFLAAQLQRERVEISQAVESMIAIGVLRRQKYWRNVVFVLDCPTGEQP